MAPPCHAGNVQNKRPLPRDTSRPLGRLARDAPINVPGRRRSSTQFARHSRPAYPVTGTNPDTWSAQSLPNTVIADHRHSPMMPCATSMLLLLVATTVTGRPQRCPFDDYAKAVLAQYYPGPAAVSPDPAALAAAVEPTAVRLEYEDSAVPRPGRSNSGPEDLARPAGHYFGFMERAPDARSTKVAPCKAAAAAAAKRPGNDTAAAAPSAAAVDKLAAYYEQLKEQHDSLARHQVQLQLYEQQQRQQQEYAVMQQQLQQQYYQQQQHAALVFDQLRKNPAFVDQLAAFIEHKRVEMAKAASPSTPPPPPPPPTPVAAPSKAPSGTGRAASGPDGPEEAAVPDGASDRRTVPVDRGDEDGCVGVKRPDARQSAAAAERRPAAASDDEDEPQPSVYDDEQSPPVLEKVYSVPSE